MVVFVIGTPSSFQAIPVASQVAILPSKRMSFLNSSKLLVVLTSRIPVGLQPFGHINQADKTLIKDNDHIGMVDARADLDLLVVDPVECRHRRPAPLRSEAREPLGILPLFDGRQGKQFHRGDRPLTASSVPPDFYHSSNLP